MRKKWWRPEGKESLDKYKANIEIDKIEHEIREINNSRLRLWIATIIVPLAVAYGTYYVVSNSGYFSAWQKQNENAEFKFKQDTLSFNIAKQMLIRSNDSLRLRNDSLKTESTTKELLLARYISIIKGGLTNNQQINKLILLNANQKSTIDSLNAIRARISIAAMGTSTDLGKLRNNNDSLRNELTKRETQIQSLYYRIEQIGVDLTYCRNDYTGYLKAARDSLNACLKASKR